MLDILPHISERRCENAENVRYAARELQKTIQYRENCENIRRGNSAVNFKFVEDIVIEQVEEEIEEEGKAQVTHLERFHSIGGQ